MKSDEIRRAILHGEGDLHELVVEVLQVKKEKAFNAQQEQIYEATTAELSADLGKQMANHLTSKLLSWWREQEFSQSNFKCLNLNQKLTDTLRLFLHAETHSLKKSFGRNGVAKKLQNRAIHDAVASSAERLALRSSKHLADHIKATASYSSLKTLAQEFEYQHRQVVALRVAILNDYNASKGSTSSTSPIYKALRDMPSKHHGDLHYLIALLLNKEAERSIWMPFHLINDLKAAIGLPHKSAYIRKGDIKPPKPVLGNAIKSNLEVLEQLVDREEKLRSKFSATCREIKDDKKQNRTALRTSAGPNDQQKTSAPKPTDKFECAVAATIVASIYIPVIAAFCLIRLPKLIYDNRNEISTKVKKPIIGISNRATALFRPLGTVRQCLTSTPNKLHKAARDQYSFIILCVVFFYESNLKPATKEPKSTLLSKSL